MRGQGVSGFWDDVVFCAVGDGGDGVMGHYKFTQCKFFNDPSSEKWTGSNNLPGVTAESGIGACL
jgi:hypothetical protein